MKGVDWPWSIAVLLLAIVIHSVTNGVALLPLIASVLGVIG
jgi:hypothetical protein